MSDNRKKNTMEGKRLLENAYLLDTPESNETYYDELAHSYNQDFVEGMGYSLAAQAARQYLSLATAEDVPIVDIGCGTGALAVELAGHGLDIVGMDISQAMLNEARKTQCYRELIKVDLTESIVTSQHAQYGALLSSGTFTHGHLGPDALKKLLVLAKANGLFIITINKMHFANLGFSALFDELFAANAIHDFKATEVAIYDGQNHEHSNDLGLLTSFRLSR